jgi:hypothetical protein
MGAVSYRFVELLAGHSPLLFAALRDAPSRKIWENSHNFPASREIRNLSDQGSP